MVLVVIDVYQCLHSLGRYQEKDRAPGFPETRPFSLTTAGLRWRYSIVLAANSRSYGRWGSRLPHRQFRTVHETFDLTRLLDSAALVKGTFLLVTMSMKKL